MVILNLREVVTTGTKERNEMRTTFRENVKKQMDDKISNFIHRLKIEPLVKKAALRGQQSITIKLPRLFMKWHHFTDYVVECKSIDNNLQYGLNYNQFLNEIKSNLEQEGSIQCQIKFEEDSKTNKLRMKSIVLNWENLVPLTLIINLPWGGFLEVDDFIENETFGQIITRLGLHPRDGTNVSIEDEGKNLSRIKVSRYQGKTVNFVVEREHEAESFDLDE
jgi:hypothetical protein